MLTDFSVKRKGLPFQGYAQISLANIFWCDTNGYKPEDQQRFQNNQVNVNGAMPLEKDHPNRLEIVHTLLAQYFEVEHKERRKNDLLKQNLTEADIDENWASYCLTDYNNAYNKQYKKWHRTIGIMIRTETLNTTLSIVSWVMSRKLGRCTRGGGKGEPFSLMVSLS